MCLDLCCSVTYHGHIAGVKASEVALVLPVRTSRTVAEYPSKEVTPVPTACETPWEVAVGRRVPAREGSPSTATGSQSFSKWIPVCQGGVA